MAEHDVPDAQAQPATPGEDSSLPVAQTNGQCAPLAGTAQQSSRSSAQLHYKSAGQSHAPNQSAPRHRGAVLPRAPPAHRHQSQTRQCLPSPSALAIAPPRSAEARRDHHRRQCAATGGSLCDYSAGDGAQARIGSLVVYRAMHCQPG